MLYKPVLPRYSNVAFEQHLLAAFVSASLPFQVAENDKFRAMLKLLNPSAENPTCQHLRDLLNKRVVAIQKEQFSDLGANTKVSLALDCWSSPNHLSFLAITAYYISETWQYREVLIGFEQVSGKHSGRSLACVVEQVLLLHKLEAWLFAITLDNASK